MKLDETEPKHTPKGTNEGESRPKDSKETKAKLTPWLRIIGGLLIIYGIFEAIYVVRNGLYHYVIISLVCWVIAWWLMCKKEGKNEH